jgi:hypothetical protein
MGTAGRSLAGRLPLRPASSAATRPSQAGRVRFKALDQRRVSLATCRAILREL